MVRKEDKSEEAKWGVIRWKLNRRVSFFLGVLGYAVELEVRVLSLVCYDPGGGGSYHQCLKHSQINSRLLLADETSRRQPTINEESKRPRPP